jgi:hypothetical protein
MQKSILHSDDQGVGGLRKFVKMATRLSETVRVWGPNPPTAAGGPRSWDCITTIITIIIIIIIINNIIIIIIIIIIITARSTTPLPAAGQPRRPVDREHGGPDCR